MPSLLNLLTRVPSLLKFIPRICFNQVVKTHRHGNDYQKVRSLYSQIPRNRGHVK